MSGAAQVLGRRHRGFLHGAGGKHRVAEKPLRKGEDHRAVTPNEHTEAISVTGPGRGHKLGVNPDSSHAMRPHSIVQLAAPGLATSPG